MCSMVHTEVDVNMEMKVRAMQATRLRDQHLAESDALQLECELQGVLGCWC